MKTNCEYIKRDFSREIVCLKPPCTSLSRVFSESSRHTKLERLKQLLQQRQELEQSLDDDEAAMDKLYMTMAEKLQIALDARLENLA